MTRRDVLALGRCGEEQASPSSVPLTLWPPSAGFAANPSRSMM